MLDAGGNVKATAGGDASVQAGGNVDVSAGGDANLSATGNVKVSGAMIDLNRWRPSPATVTSAGAR